MPREVAPSGATSRAVPQAAVRAGDHGV